MSAAIGGRRRARRAARARARARAHVRARARPARRRASPSPVSILALGKDPGARGSRYLQTIKVLFFKQ